MSPACRPLDDIAQALSEHFRRRPENPDDLKRGEHEGGPDSHLKRQGGTWALMLFPERECQAWARRLRARNFGEDADAIEKDYAALVATAAEFDKQLCVRAGACDEWRLGRRNEKITAALVELNSAQEKFRTAGGNLAHTLQATAESISTEAWATSIFEQVKADCAALQLEELRAKARFFVNSKIAALKEQYPQAPDCAIEAAARAELIADQSTLLLSMRDLLLPGAGSLDGGDLSPDSSYLLAQAIVLWHEFSKDASARAGDCVKLIPNSLPSGDRTIKGHTEKTATLSVLHSCGCLFSLALLLDRKARAPDTPVPDPDEHLELVLADGYSPQAAAEFIKDILPDWAIREFERVRTGIELELAAIHRAAAMASNVPPAVDMPKVEKRRIWDKNYCPICAKPGVEWVSRAEFERRSKKDGNTVKRETAGDRIKDGTYLANTAGRLPWCPVCKERTPMGTGESQPEIDERQSASEDQARTYGEQCAVCAAKLLNLSSPPSLAAPVDREEGRWTSAARDAARNALTAVLAEHRARGRELTRDEAEAIAEPRIKSFLKEQQGFEAAAMGSPDDVENAIAASENPRPKGQRKAPHKGEGRNAHSGD